MKIDCPDAIQKNNMETTGDARQSTARLRCLYRLKNKEHKSTVIILNIKREPFIRGNKPNGVK
ncbi:hypothetical protein, partial [Escherichia coli]|uniref:hypothetical protein n=1 Tax=Escherichia coli TaxID=562 RepID=UPI001A7EE618